MERYKNLPIKICIDCKLNKPIYCKDRCSNCYQKFSKKNRKLKQCDKCKKLKIIHANNKCKACYELDKYHNDNNFRKKYNISRKKYYENNKEKILAKTKPYYQNNKEKMRKWYSNYCKEKAKNNISYRISRSIRSRIASGLKGKDKSSNTEKLLGCTFIEFEKYLENNFKKGMSWKNYGFGRSKWNIDHTIPVSKFNLENEDEQKECFHFSNQKPMWQPENQSKGNKIR